MFVKIFFLLEVVRANLNSVQRDFTVSKIFDALLWIIKKKVLFWGSSIAFNSAFDEFEFRF